MLAVAKRKDTRRTRTKTKNDDGELTITATLTARQMHLRRQRWRALKKQFDQAHRAGMESLKQRDYESLDAAIVHERRVIDELRAIVEEARTQVLGYKTSSFRR